MKDVATKWSVNETLLQSYRSIFISSQSFLLAVGVLSFDKPKWLLIALAVMSVAMIWVIWLPVVITRHRIADYYKYALELSEDDRNQLCEEKTYVKCRCKREQANEILKLKNGEWRLTRIKVDIIIPSLFTVIWMLLFVLKVLFT